MQVGLGLLLIALAVTLALLASGTAVVGWRRMGRLSVLLEEQRGELEHRAPGARTRVTAMATAALGASDAVDRARVSLARLDAAMESGTAALRAQRGSLDAVSHERLVHGKRWLERTGLVLKVLKLQRGIWR